MANDKMMTQMSSKDGFIAALDQSGGSTPGALRLYGIPDSEYSGDAEMFRLMHEMRVRIVTAPAFNGSKVIAAILFERTMDGEAKGKPVPTYLWEERGVVPIVKVDKGLEAAKDGVRLMKAMPDLDALCARAMKLGVFGTKMRSVIDLASKDGIAAIARQQFDIRRADRQARARADSRAGSLDQQPGQGRGGDDPPRRTDEGARRPAGRAQGDVQADAARSSGFLRAAGQGRAGRARGGALRRLHPRRGVQAPRPEPRRDRELLTRAHPGLEALDERRRVQQGAGRGDRRDLSGLERRRSPLKGRFPHRARSRERGAPFSRLGRRWAAKPPDEGLRRFLRKAAS